MKTQQQAVPQVQLEQTPSGMLQRAAINASPVKAPSRAQVLRSPGRPLDADASAFTGPRFGHDFSQVPIRPAEPPMPQARLSVGRPGDQREQEAERAAELITQAEFESSGDKSLGGSIRPVQAGELSDQVPAPLEDRIQSLMHRGHPLPGHVRAYFESRFGYDFSQVRVHTDAPSAGLAHDLHARSFTVGSHIVFGAGQYQTATMAGKRLLAHELTHVVQQREQVSPSTIGLLQMQADMVTFEPEVIKVSAAEKSQLLRKAGWQQRDVIMVIKDFKGEPLRGHRVFAEFKGPNGTLTEAADVQGGSVIWSNIWLKPEGTVRIMAVSTGQAALAPEGVALYKLPDKGPVKFDVEQQKTEVTVTAKTSEEAASKAGAKGTAGIEFEVIKLGGEVSSEESKTKGTSLETSWKVILPTSTLVVKQLP